MLYSVYPPRVIMKPGLGRGDEIFVEEKVPVRDFREFEPLP